MMLNNFSRLDYFAAHASEEDLKAYLPRTVGETRDLLIKLKVIPATRTYGSALSSYDDKDSAILRSWARYQFAQAMIKMADDIRTNSNNHNL